MALISTKVHGAVDYVTGVALLGAPSLLRTSDAAAAWTLRATGASILGASAVTDYELGLRRKLPMPLHLALDAGTGALLLGTVFALRRRRVRAKDWAVHLAAGAGEIAGALLTAHQPADRARADALPGAVPGVTGEGVAARTVAGEWGPRLATPPIETPGPSVTPPATPASDVERAEWADSGRPDADAPQERRLDDLLVAQEESAAAAEARMIGGVVPPDAGDPAMEPVYQAGGGEQEGWEAAEAELVDNASHSDGHGDPERDAPAPEVESDRSTAVYGEADEIPSTEVRDEPPEGTGKAPR